jgi:hypothetical protein
MAMLLSYFSSKLTPQEIAAEVPVSKNDKGEEVGTVTQQLATWCINKKFKVKMYTADFQIIDLSWENLSKNTLLEHLQAIKNFRNIPSLGKDLSKIYVQSYIDFIKAGGELYIRPYMTTELIDKLLRSSPLFITVSYGVFYNRGRNNEAALRKSKLDDKNGKTGNHSIIIYGQDNEDNYLIADPWEEPGRHSIEPERLLASMTAAQIECDNLLFQISV